MSSKESVFSRWDAKTTNRHSDQLLQPHVGSAAARHILFTMAPYDLHKRLINDYILCRRGATSLLQRDTSKDKTDYDVIKENHRFLWDDAENPDTWEAQLAKKYYDKLFKEYCICDLTMYKQNKVAMRWRTEAELISGCGQFTCAEKHCQGRDGLRTWEVNFAYVEHSEKKNALVKLRLCSDCSIKLNYGSKKREIKRLKRVKKKHQMGKVSKNNRDNESNESSSSDPPDASKSNIQPAQPELEKDETSIWREAGKPDEEKAREDEFEEYLEDLFM